MRRILVVAALCATLLPIAACSDAPKSDSTALPGATGSAGPNGAPGAGGPNGASSSPGGPGAGTTGTSTDKAACEAISVKLGTWGGAFADAAAGLAAAGNDTAKVQVVIDKVKAANTKFAADLRAEGDKSKDAQLKKVAGDLAAVMEKISTSLNAQQVAANPDALMALFDSTDYTNAADNYEKLCGGA